MKRYLNLINAILFSLCGVIWICRAIRDDSIFYLFLALVWISGGVIWLVRFIKERNDSQKENENG